MDGAGRYGHLSARLGALAFTLVAILVLPAARSADRDALREIVQRRCLPDWLHRNNPAPCERVSVGADVESGYALLADRKGGAHFLLIPTGTLTGIESPQLLSPYVPNYFAAAWQARDLVERVLGHAVTRDQIGLAVNSRLTRGQDQLHIHIECLGETAYRALQSHAAMLGSSWTRLPIGWWHYQARRVMDRALERSNPFELLAAGLPDARAHMGSYTIVVAGMRFADGPGFVLIAGRDVPGGEHLLDRSCAIAHRPPAH
jgi:CDP-diacylglycerol pyrophosphatase